jgi:hypothetical protein
MWIDCDWNQFKKNLIIERKEWEIYANQKSHIKAERDETIEQERILYEAKITTLKEEYNVKIETLRNETKAKLDKLEDDYRKRINKKTKPTITISGL